MRFHEVNRLLELIGENCAAMRHLNDTRGAMVSVENEHFRVLIGAQDRFALRGLGITL